MSGPIPMLSSTCSSFPAQMGNKGAFIRLPFSMKPEFVQFTSVVRVAPSSLRYCLYPLGCTPGVLTGGKPVVTCGFLMYSPTRLSSACDTPPDFPACSAFRVACVHRVSTAQIVSIELDSAPCGFTASSCGSIVITALQHTYHMSSSGGGGTHICSPTKHPPRELGLALDGITRPNMLLINI